MAVIETWLHQDLQEPVKVNYLDGNLFSNNGNGNRIGVVLTNNGEALASISGTVSGYVVTADGTTVPCTGSKSGNRASILIPAAAYQPGSIFITVFVTDGTTVTTIGAVSTTVMRSRTNAQVDPGSAVTDWTQTINAAMQSVETAAENLGGIVAVPYASITFPVPLGKYTYHNNNLYRCITPIASSESFTPAHWTQVKLGDDVSDLKSALSESISDVYIQANGNNGNKMLQFTNNMIIPDNVEIGAVVTLEPYGPTVLDYVIENCQEGDIFTITGTGGGSARLWAFIDSENKLLSKANANATATNLVLTAPENASKIIINAKNAVAIKGYTLNKRIGDIESELLTVQARKFPNDLTVQNKWEQGFWLDINTNPRKYDIATSIRTEQSFNAKKNIRILRTKSGFDYVYTVFNSNNELVGGLYDSWGTNDSVLNLTEGNYTLYFAIRRSDRSSITIHDLVNSGIYITVDDVIMGFPDDFECNLGLALKLSKNLFNYQSNNLFGAYYNKANTLVKDKTVFQTDYIQVKQGHKYKVNEAITGTYFVLWYDSSKQFLNYTDVSANNGYYIAEAITSAEYARFFIDAPVPDTYTILDITEYIKSDCSNDDILEPKNVFNRSDFLDGQYYNTSGQLVVNSQFGQTGLIPVQYGHPYKYSAIDVFVLWYDSSKTLIGNTATNTQYKQNGYAYVNALIDDVAYARFLIDYSQTPADEYTVQDINGEYVVKKQYIPNDEGTQTQESPYNGKTGVAFGTSLTYRAQTTGGYLNGLEALSGITFDNQGIGNSQILPNQSYPNMLSRIKNYQSYSGKDIVLLEGFVNDWYRNNTSLGNYTDTEETTVCGCVRSALSHIMTQAPTATVFIILDHYGRNYGGVDCRSTAIPTGGTYTQYEFYEKIAKIAESLGVVVIKEYALSEISEYAPQYLADDIHLNTLGSQQSANTIWSVMRNIYPKAQQ